MAALFFLPASAQENNVAEQPAPKAAAPKLTDYPVVKLQSLDKATARTVTFEARVGSTVKFGPIYIRVQACRKAAPTEQPESASFLQVWEVTPKGESKWVYSGWMFASSPALSPMDHPIYDVWVLDCLERKSSDPAPPKVEAKVEAPAADAADDLSGENVKDAEPEETLVRDGELSGADAEPPKEAPPVTDLPKVTLPGE